MPAAEQDLCKQEEFAADGAPPIAQTSIAPEHLRDIVFADLALPLEYYVE